MRSGTAIGILVGGAILLLAASPRNRPGQAGGVYPNAGGALNPLNWFGSNGSGALVQPGNIFGQQSASPSFDYQGAANPSVTSSGGLLRQGYGTNNGAAPVFGGNSVIPASYNYGAGSGNYDYAASSPLPFASPSGGSGSAYLPVMTPGGGFTDYSNLLGADSQQITADMPAPNFPAYG